MEHKKTHKIYLPIMNRGIWSRVYSIKSTVEKILSEYKDQEINIISIGAGLDTLYFLLKEKYSNFKYIEFDYDDICFKKVEVIKKSNLLKSVICKEDFDNNVKIASGNLHSNDYYLLRCDVSKTDDFLEKLKETSINTDNLTIIIAECVLVYIKKDITYKMLTTYTSLFKNIVMLEYDLVNALDPFGQEMIDNLKLREITLCGYEEVPDCKSHETRYLETGFATSEVKDMLDYYKNHIPKDVKSQIEHKEFMDEFEEWNMLQNHSCFGYGVRTEGSQFSKLNDLIKL
jgi:O-methyltransferase involved in polyketide biosynthesis